MIFQTADEKSITIMEMEEKENIHPLPPRHNLHRIRGTCDEPNSSANCFQVDTDDYICTDEDDVPEAISRLQGANPHLITKLNHDNHLTRNTGKLDPAEEVERKSPLDLFAEFYEKQNGQTMTEEQKAFSATIISSIWEENA